MSVSVCEPADGYDGLVPGILGSGPMAMAMGGPQTPLVLSPEGVL